MWVFVRRFVDIPDVVATKLLPERKIQDKTVNDGCSS